MEKVDGEAQVLEGKTEERIITVLNKYVVGRILGISGIPSDLLRAVAHDCLSYTAFLERVVRCDTVILHLLLGSGVKAHLFRRIYYRAKRFSSRCVIIEPNAEARGRPDEMWGLQRVRAEWLTKFIPVYRALEFFGSGRFEDSLILVVVDSESDFMDMDGLH